MRTEAEPRILVEQLLPLHNSWNFLICPKNYEVFFHPINSKIYEYDRFNNVDNSFFLRVKIIDLIKVLHGLVLQFYQFRRQ